MGEPEGYRETLGALPEGVAISTSVGAPVDLAQVFVTDMEGLRKRLPSLKKHVKKSGLIWIMYHKGTSSQNTLRDSGISPWPWFLWTTPGRPLGLRRFNPPIY